MKIIQVVTAAALAGASLTLVARQAAAQGLDVQISETDPLTHLDPKRWAYMMTHEVNGASVVGRPEVIMLNASGESLTVTCGRWTLVGAKPYDKANPNVLPPWSATVVHTEGFDGYCKEGVTAQSPSGETTKGALTSADGTFSSATFITFRSH